MYVRPRTVDEALDRLSEPGAVVIGGGTKVNPARPVEPVLIVDLQALGLDGVDARADGVVTVGATATLQQLVDEPAVPAAVRDAARREAPSTLRTLATVGGCVATADPASELLAALLVHDARVSIVSQNGTRPLELAALLADRGRLTGGIITGLTLQADGATSIARTGRTRADRAIVAAVARRTPAGDVRLAVTGVGATPLLIDTADGVANAVGRLDPPGDFRGSSDYRRSLASVLVGRALEEVR